MLEIRDLPRLPASEIQQPHLTASLAVLVGLFGQPHEGDALTVWREDGGSVATTPERELSWLRRVRPQVHREEVRTILVTRTIVIAGGVTVSLRSPADRAHRVDRSCAIRGDVDGRDLTDTQEIGRDDG